MMPSTHALMSWCLANVGGAEGRRSRLVVTLSGVIPDIDGLGGIADFVLSKFGIQSFFFENWHHVLLHNFWMGFLCAAAGWKFTRGSARTALLCLAAFNLHMICDLIGSAGEGGETWPMLYLWPFSNWEFSLSWQWRLDSPINIMITVILEIWMLSLAWRKGFSPIELFSPALDKKLFARLRTMTQRDDSGHHN
jgi:inner membrane protein